jgi:acetyltransferase
MPLTFKTVDGQEITIRAIQPGDADIEQAFVRSLSLRSKHLRFFAPVKELSAQMLDQFTHPHYPDNWALIATVQDGNHEKEIGVARYAPAKNSTSSEFAVVVADEWQGRGIGAHLMNELLVVAKTAGIRQLEGFVLKENQRMLVFVEKLGFITQQDPHDSSVVRVTKSLGD